MLGALLLLACVPSPVQLNRLGGIDIEINAREECAFHFIARSHARRTVNECDIQIWQDKENAYCLRVHAKNPNLESLVTEYTLITG